MNLLITAIGKRVQLIKHLKESFKVIGVDASINNAAKEFVDEFYVIPKITDEKYITSILDICKNEKVDALIPLYEEEFPILLNNKKLFDEIDVKLIISNMEVINVTKDKEETFKYFNKLNILTPYVYSQNEIVEIIKNKDKNKLPLIIKPKDGMGSSNVFKINNIKELEFFKEYVKSPIIQEYINGKEYTVDVLVDTNGKPIYVIPRLRVEVRAGEVSKSQTVRNKKIQDKTIEVINALNRLKNSENLGLFGPLTIQFIEDENKELYLLEINPRFGGGVPLAFKAGANYGQAIHKILIGEDLICNNTFDEVTMLRYDEAIYILNGEM